MEKKYKIFRGVFTIILVLGLALYLAFSYNPSTKKNEENVPPPVTSLLGRAEVSYAGGVINRNNNIELGVARINGTVVPPGAEFSFLETLGPVLESDGFKESKTFYEGEVVLGLGGGLCHVSTTLFQSVLKSGLPVTERHNHTFTVPFYETGLDATISDVGPDLKFINDTEYDITITGKTLDKVAIFEIYGVADGRVPKISEAEIYDHKDPPPTLFLPTRDLPVGERKCDQSRQSGYTSRRIYDVLYTTGATNQQTFESTYKPLQRICKIGVDDATDFTGCNIYTAYSHQTGVKCPTDPSDTKPLEITASE